MQRIDGAAYGVATFSLMQVLLLRLIDKRIMTNEEVRDLFQEVADLKIADARAGGITSFDSDAAALAAEVAEGMHAIIDDGAQNSN